MSNQQSANLAILKEKLINIDLTDFHKEHLATIEEKHSEMLRPYFEYAKSRGKESLLSVLSLNPPISEVKFLAKVYLDLYKEGKVSFDKCNILYDQVNKIFASIRGEE